MENAKRKWTVQGCEILMNF